ncbi:hypothetical protein JCM8547_000158 [Rhodosporidiobolus lusitaniae]
MQHCFGSLTDIAPQLFRPLVSWITSSSSHTLVSATLPYPLNLTETFAGRTFPLLTTLTLSSKSSGWWQRDWATGLYSTFPALRSLRFEDKQSSSEHRVSSTASLQSTILACLPPSLSFLTSSLSSLDGFPLSLIPDLLSQHSSLISDVVRFVVVVNKAGLEEAKRILRQEDESKDWMWKSRRGFRA